MEERERKEEERRKKVALLISEVAWKTKKAEYILSFLFSLLQSSHLVYFSLGLQYNISYH